MYQSVIRSVLEYSSVVFHSQLTKYLSNLIESVQKKVLRTIYGYDLDYQSLLEKSGLNTLHNRREEALTKFALKTLKNPKYSNRWFPTRNIQRVNRETKPYLEEHAAGSRLYNSPIFEMRRRLNNSTSIDQIDITGVFNNPFDN